ncbi:hypothetical protein ES044_17530 [Polaribacter sp. IC066]|nr:hypothetical protein ES044_17530 [Polaribacter sp. IC066]
MVKPTTNHEQRTTNHEKRTTNNEPRTTTIVFRPSFTVLRLPFFEHRETNKYWLWAISYWF